MIIFCQINKNKNKNTLILNTGAKHCCSVYKPIGLLHKYRQYITDDYFSNSYKINRMNKHLVYTCESRCEQKQFEQIVIICGSMNHWLH